MSQPLAVSRPAVSRPADPSKPPALSGPTASGYGRWPSVPITPVLIEPAMSLQTPAFEQARSLSVTQPAMAIPPVYIKPAVAPPALEFCIKLSMSSIEGRPLSVSLARYDDKDNPIIGCSLGFLALSGLPRAQVLGRNCRFLNAGIRMPLRERLRAAIDSGSPFMGVLENVRSLGGGQNEIFQNLLHLAVIVAGSRSYIIGLQADVTGLNLDLSDSSHDAVRLQMIIDNVLSAGVDSWVHLQEGMYHCAPVYLHIRQGWKGDDEVWIQEEVERSTNEPVQAAPDHCMVLAPRFPHAGSEDDDLKWRFLVLGNCSGPMAPVRGPPGLTLTGADETEPLRLSLSHVLPVLETAPKARSQDACWISPQMGTEANTWTSTMKNQLRTLNLEDPANVMSARGISKLGMSSSSKLRSHFSHYGQVKAVHVPFVHKKRSKEPRSAGRGFIVMDSPETVAKILTQGPEHVVDGVKVLLERFSAKESEDQANLNDRAG